VRQSDTQATSWAKLRHNRMMEHINDECNSRLMGVLGQTPTLVFLKTVIHEAAKAGAR
jgi:hypothetical protein